jgi:shikimate kinase
LVGLPGSGKTTIGKQVAERLARRFFDLDEEVERQEGRSIAEVFAADGEEYFRHQESLVTERLAESPAAVIAPGGGWMRNPANVSRLRPPARVVYLRVSPHAALTRMGETVASRPLLGVQDPSGDLHRLYWERDSFYMNADLFLDTELLGMEEVVGLISAYVATLGEG